MVGVLVLASLGYLPAAQATCLSELVRFSNRPPLSPIEVACITSDEETGRALSLLCTTDQTELSDQYRVYLTFQKPYSDLNKSYGLTADEAEKGSILDKIVSMENLWESKGAKTKVEEALRQVTSRKADCDLIDKTH